MNAWLALAIAIILEVIASTLLKFSEGYTKLLPTIGALVTFGVCFYFVAIAYRTLPMGTAYAVWSGVGIVLVALVGLFLGQKPDLPALIGMAMIIGGVLIINLLSKSVSYFK